jgi:hypothetical protein
MGFIRFSLAGQEGLVVPDKKLITKQRLLELGGLMLQQGAVASALEPAMLEDITPPSFADNRYRYLLTTTPEEPVEKATVHFLPTNSSHSAMIVSHRQLPQGIDRQVTIPDDSVGFPLLRPTLDGKQLELHELIVPTYQRDPQAIIESIGR